MRRVATLALVFAALWIIQFLGLLLMGIPSSTREWVLLFFVGVPLTVLAEYLYSSWVERRQKRRPLPNRLELPR